VNLIPTLLSSPPAVLAQKQRRECVSTRVLESPFPFVSPTHTPTGRNTEITKSGMFSLCRWEKEMGRKKMYLETGWGKATELI